MVKCKSNKKYLFGGEDHEKRFGNGIKRWYGNGYGDACMCS